MITPRFPALLALLAALLPLTRCDAATVSLVAGTGAIGSGGDGGPAVQATLNQPFGIVRGPDGALWFADYAANRVRRIARDGVITTVVGNGQATYAGDNGPASEASLNHPHEIRFDREGDLFIADTDNHAVRRVELRTGRITTFAGSGRAVSSGDGGAASQAELKEPISIQFSPSGDLSIIDIGNHVVRRVDGRTRQISTFAGTGTPGTTPDASPIAGTPLKGPRSLDFDGAGNLWLVTREGNQLLRLDSAKPEIRIMAGTGAKGFTGHGMSAREATLSGPKGIAVAPGGDIYLADTENHAIRRYDARRGTLETFAGTGSASPVFDADPRKCGLARPHGVFVDADGTVFIGDSDNHRILSVRP